MLSLQCPVQGYIAFSPVKDEAFCPSSAAPISTQVSSFPSVSVTNSAQTASLTLRPKAGSQRVCRRGPHFRLAVAAVDDVETEAVESEEFEQEDDAEFETGKLIIYFKAEGFMTDVQIGNVTKVLEAQEDVSNVKVSVVDGAAVVECIKESTVGATGAAAQVLEAIQQVGFQVQMVYLGFDDEEAEADTTFFDFGSTKLPDDVLPDKVPSQ
eukprot:TRINITY_DN4071_c0_g1_i1.p1 TRINITY_DN4071_c0_g1~~TRINITY_DN4071_c0_g1_i1.p1  ORF type:complete len:211 (-),score=41.81 TRINITY_DN4071_c0_g1_i1:520-1152(-)